MSSGLLPHERLHRLHLHVVDIESERSHGDAHHGLRMVEELERLHEQRELGLALVEEEVNGVAVELE